MGRVLTRDRVEEFQVSTNEEMPYRLEVVHAFRSENAYLWYRLQKCRKEYHNGAIDADLQVKSLNGAEYINSRLNEGEAFCFHGTNPTSTMSILRTGFKLDAAGVSAGTMFGYGIYLAECSS